ncbi:MAG TPA: ribosomal protein S18-alanine N-acetyltransferase [Terracidiphilus sp.]|nr:ribosomal protein S18-alanine N-acetyltransferase [Terracidiphilus sp.]
MNSDPGRVEIRDMCKADLETVIGIAKTLKDAPEWPPQVYNAIIRPGSAGEHVTLVAQMPTTKEVCGFAIASLILPEAELESIAITPGVQRQGIGRKLLSELLRRLQQAGVETVFLEVRASNSAAIGLYNSFGFNETGRRPRYYSDPIEDGVLMSCELD